MSGPLQSDDVFVGAGSAGPNKRVLRVEASGIDRCRWIPIPSAMA